MKVVHVITGLSDGGAEGALYRLCIADADNDHVVVSLTGAGKYGSLLRDGGIVVYELNMTRSVLSLRSLVALVQIMKKMRPDVIQTWMYHADLIGGLAARLAGIKSISWGIRHSDLVPGESSRLTIMVANICAYISRVVPRMIICCSIRARQVHEELGYCSKKMTVIPNGYDLSRYSPDLEARKRVRAELGLPDNVKLIGMVARFNPQKDQGNLIDALVRVSVSSSHQWHAVLVGSGVDEGNDALVQRIERHGLSKRISLLGARSDIPELMNALDLHVLSSAFGEAFPNVVAEAMACGVPVVVTDVGDAAMIAGGLGWTVPPRDDVALAAAITSALQEMDDEEHWIKKKGDVRQRIVDNFSLEKMVAAYEACWRSIRA